MAKVVHSATASMPYVCGDLQVKAGDPLFLLAEHDAFWYAECNGTAGLVPKQVIAGIKPVDPRKAFVAVAVFSYTPQGDGMEHVLPVFAGEEVYILNAESGWWFGVLANERLEGKKAGYVPSTYLERRAASRRRQVVQQLRHATIRNAAAASKGSGDSRQGPKPSWERHGQQRDLARAERQAKMAEKRAEVLMEEMARREREMQERQKALEAKLAMLEERLSSGAVQRKPLAERKASAEAAAAARAQASGQEDIAKPAAAADGAKGGAAKESKFDKKRKLRAGVGALDQAAEAEAATQSPSQVQDDECFDYEFMSMSKVARPNRGQATFEAEAPEAEADAAAEQAAPEPTTEESSIEIDTTVATTQSGGKKKTKYKRVTRMRPKSASYERSGGGGGGDGTELFLVPSTPPAASSTGAMDSLHKQAAAEAEAEAAAAADADEGSDDEGGLDDLLDEFDDLVELDEHRGRHRKRAFSKLFDADGALAKFMEWKRRAEERGREHPY